MKILVAEDNQLIAKALAGTLAELGPETDFVQTDSAWQTLQRLDGSLDLALIDMDMPDATGVGMIKQVRGQQPDLPVTVLSGQDDPAVIRAALDAGARGFITKCCSPQIMLLAVRLVLAGGTYVPPALLREGAPAADAAPVTSMAQLRALLSRRQMQVLNMLLDDLSNKEIMRRLNMGMGTVKTHMQAIFRALKVNSRAQAAALVRGLGQKRDAG